MSETPDRDLQAAEAIAENIRTVVVEKVEEFMRENEESAKKNISYPNCSDMIGGFFYRYDCTPNQNVDSILEAIFKQSEYFLKGIEPFAQALKLTDEQKNDLRILIFTHANKTLTEIIEHTKRRRDDVRDGITKAYAGRGL